MVSCCFITTTASRVRVFVHSALSCDADGAQDDVSTLELWVYEEAETLGEDANVYVHHELMLPAFPLCLAWLDCPIVRQHGRWVTNRERAQFLCDEVQYDDQCVCVHTMSSCCQPSPSAWPGWTVPLRDSMGGGSHVGPPNH